MKRKWKKIISTANLIRYGIGGIDLKEKLERKIEEYFTDKIRESASMKSQEIVRKSHRNIKQILRNEQKYLKGFKRRLNDVWSTPLDLLDIFLQISFEAGSEFNKEIRPVAAKEKDYVFDVLCHLHGRACRISGEILLLMRNGYASGALARWRALHEIAVTGNFVRKYGNGAAEKYLLHEVVESFEAMKVYNEHCKKLGYDPYSEEDMIRINEVRDKACERFGKEFKKQYGWATGFTDIANHNLRFTDLERYASLDYLRPYYVMSCDDIHSNVKGITYNIGVAEGWDDNFVLAGPTNAGFADPGQLTAISNYQITYAFLSHKPIFGNLVYLGAMSILLDEIKAAFMKSKEVLDKRIEKNPGTVIGRID